MDIPGTVTIYWKNGSRAVYPATIIPLAVTDPAAGIITSNETGEVLFDREDGGYVSDLKTVLALIRTAKRLFPI